MELKQSIERAKLKLVEGDPRQAFEELFSRFKMIHDKLDANNPVLEQAHYILAISAIGSLVCEDQKRKMQRSQKSSSWRPSQTQSRR